MRRLVGLSFAVLAACTVPGVTGGKDQDDGGGAGGSLDGGGGGDGGIEWEPCEEVWVHHVGPDNPTVGDVWTVWLKCDGAILTGPTVIRFEPDLSFALVDENEITWSQSGTTILHVQTGTERASTEVTVGTD